MIGLRHNPIRTATMLVLAGWLALVAAACGEPTKTTPSPEAIETAESASRQVTVGAPFSTTPADGDEKRDVPIVLDGRLFGDGDTGVILAHMRPADQTSWFPYATELAETGTYTVLTFDFRGFGASTGDKEFDRTDTDLTAVYRYMRDELGISKIFIVGASMGGTAALAVAAHEKVAGVVSISSPAQFETVDALGAVPLIRAPKLFLTSKDDVPAARSQGAFWEVAPEPRDQHVFEGDAHGTNLFSSPDAPDFGQRITAFLSSH